MITRRTFLEGVSATSAAALLARAQAPAKLTAALSSGNEDYTRYVKIRIGTGGHGHTYPGATVPSGMVQLSPDTYNDGWDYCSGYHYSDSSIMGFSHTHLSGTGCADLLDFLLMPGVGPVKLVPGTRENPDEGYRSRFSHEDETAEPGYYSVLLKDHAIRAELTSTERVGFHRYTFPEKADAHFILDLVHANGGDKNHVLWSNLKVVGKDMITGGRSTDLWAPGRQIYFAMRFSRPFDACDIYAADQKLDPTARSADGKSLKVVLHYKTNPKEVILVKTGISGVSAEGALKNLESEAPTWDFDQVRAAAHTAWRRELATIEVESTNEKQKEIFYTSFYHALVAPTLFDDVDGSYRGMDGQVHQLTAGEHNYSSFSLWDTYRAAHPLYTLVQSQRVSGLVNCLVRMAEESPAGMPVWPLHGKETGTMTGYHSVVVMAEACRKGIPGIDYARAWKVVRKRALEENFEGLDYFRRTGYLPADKEAESASKTLDYAYDAWAAATLAHAAGAEEDAAILRKQAAAYRSLYDQSTTFVRPKLESGAWTEPFAPNELGHSDKWRDYTESNPWVTTFSEQHDPKGLANLLGGREALVAKLDGLFNASSVMPPDAPPDIAGLVGQYAHGNEPGHHIAYLYCYAGAPHKTQERVRSLLETMYNNEPDGLAGNEDCGQMSAWYVLSSLGFYPVDPVSGNYVFGAPLFDRAALTLANGKQFTIEVQRRSPEDRYIQSVTLNGTPHTNVWFAHQAIQNGGSLVFVLGSQPGAFGSKESEAPPSMSS